MSEKKPGEASASSEETPTRKLSPGEPASSISNATHPDETQDYQPLRPKLAPLLTDPIVPPRAFGRYRVDGVLGQGGYGTVYKGHDTQLDRPVAIKAQRTDRAKQFEQSEEFIQEARRLARLRHPGIVTVHDIGVQDDLIYIVSDFVQGVTVKDWLKVHRPTWQEATRIIAAVAAALAHAHSHRMVHRDVKPGNIILTADLQPVLVDFGLGLDEKDTSQQRGVIMGTPAYMSPEQASGQAHRIDGRTDIYGLGIVLYELLTGHLPFNSPITEELLRQVLQDEPQPPRQLVPQIPRALELICMKAIAKPIHDRFTTAGDMANELQHLLTAVDSQVRHAGEQPTMNLGVAPASTASVPSTQFATPAVQTDAPSASKSDSSRSEPPRRTSPSAAN